MSINFSSKNTKLPGALKAFTEKNLSTIEKISGEIIDAEINVSEEKLDFRVLLSLKTKQHSYQVEEKDPILKQALRKALNTLKAQAKKNKEKLKNDKRRNKEGFFNKLLNREPTEPSTPLEKTTNQNLTVSHNFTKKPITIEEAIFFLKESGENAYMFTNTETNCMSVIFYDTNKNISIIEAV